MMLKYRRECFTLSLQDPALLYLGLSFQSEQIELAKRDKFRESYLVLRNKAIRLINGRFQQKLHVVQDSTINCIAHMAIYEVSSL
jgi:hypothetical protein